ncbi:hypothetical protein VTN31DRAFT_5027 [Thermomyces dupontii]|uniref:uncharacterized protein n=1 Tax=Talaromyces thermophilus TaxID=28565 RepID=UPI003742A1E6
MDPNGDAAVHDPAPPNLVPIAQLSPDLDDLASRSFRAVVTLVWPFSSSSRKLSLLLAEPDFRLRNRHGQVRVTFAGACAEELARTKVGIGDEVVLSLDGASWTESSSAAATPGKSLQYELQYTRRLRLKAIRDDQVLASLDVEYPGHDTDDLAASTPARPINTGNATSPDRTSPAEWETPAFLKTARMSLGSPLTSAFDPFVEDQDEESKRRRKRPRFSFPSSEWKLVDEPEQPEEKQVTNGDVWFASDEEELDRMDEDAVEHHPTPKETSPGGICEDEEACKVPPEEPGAAIPPELPPARATSPGERGMDVPSVQVEHPPHGTDRLPADTPRLQPVPSPGLPTPSPMTQTEPSAPMGYFAGISVHKDASILVSADEVATQKARPCPDTLHISTAAQEAEALAVSADNTDLGATVVHHAAADHEPRRGPQSEHARDEVLAEKILDESVADGPESDQEDEGSVIGDQGDQTDMSELESSVQESEHDSAGSVASARSIDRVSRDDVIPIDSGEEDSDDDGYSEEEGELHHSVDETSRIQSHSPTVSAHHLQRDESDDSTSESDREEVSEDEERSIELVGRSEGEEEEEEESGAFSESVGSEIEDEDEEYDEEEEEEDESDASRQPSPSPRPPASSYPEVIVLDSDSDEEPQPPPEPRLRSERNDQTESESSSESETAVDEVQDGMVSEDQSQEELSPSEKDESVYDDREADQLADDDAETNNVEADPANIESADAVYVDAHRPVMPTAQSTDQGLILDRTPSIHLDETPDGEAQLKQEQLAQLPEDASHVKRGQQLVISEHTQPSFIEQETVPVGEAPDQAILVPTPQATQLEEIKGEPQAKSPSLPQETAPPSVTDQDPPPLEPLVEQLGCGDETKAAIAHAGSEQATSPSDPATETLEDEVVLVEDRSSLRLQSSSPARPSDLHHKTSSPTLDRQAAGLRTQLSYYPRLCTLLEWFGSTIDVMAVVVEARPSSRASSGRRDFFVTFDITDSSMAGATVSVHIVRPNPADLPTVSPGNGVLLRNFHVQSHGHAMTLSNGDSSAWAVFKYDDEDLTNPEMSGPQVEYRDQEREYLAELRDWYLEGGGASLVADYMLQSSLIQEEYEAATPPSSVASSETASIASSSQSRRSRRRDRRRYRRITVHELRSGTKYAESGSNVHELRDGTLYGAYT